MASPLPRLRPLTTFSSNAKVCFNTLPLEYPRTDKRFRLFDTSFGDVVIYPAGVPITGGKTYRQVVDDLRAAWATYTLRGDARTGLATSVDNS